METIPINEVKVEQYEYPSSFRGYFCEKWEVRILDIMEQAIHKLDTELETTTTAGEKAYLYAINQIVRALLLEGEDYAEKVLEEKHTITRAYKVMLHVAQENSKGATSTCCVCISPDEAQDIIGRFYGFWGEPFDFDPDETPKRTVPPATYRPPTIVQNKYVPLKANKLASQLNLFGEEA